MITIFNTLENTNNFEKYQKNTRLIECFRYWLRILNEIRTFFKENPE